MPPSTQSPAACLQTTLSSSGFHFVFLFLYAVMFAYVRRRHMLLRSYRMRRCVPLSPRGLLMRIPVDGALLIKLMEHVRFVNSKF